MQSKAFVWMYSCMSVTSVTEYSNIDQKEEITNINIIFENEYLCECLCALASRQKLFESEVVMRQEKIWKRKIWNRRERVFCLCLNAVIKEAPGGGAVSVKIPGLYFCEEGVKIHSWISVMPEQESKRIVRGCAVTIELFGVQVVTATEG